jgi:hypothetical protein
VVNPLEGKAIANWAIRPNRMQLTSAVSKVYKPHSRALKRALSITSGGGDRGPFYTYMHPCLDAQDKRHRQAVSMSVDV